MGKNIVYPFETFTEFLDEPYLKKLSLLYDKIYVCEASLSLLFEGSTPEYLIYQRSTFEYLIEKEIIKVFPYNFKKFDNPENNKTLNDIQEELRNVLSHFSLPNSKRSNKANLSDLTPDELEKLRQKFFFDNFLASDLSTRLDAIYLSQKTNDDFYPFLRINPSTPIENKKANVINLILSDIPEPEPNTPWEAILDYKSDEDIRNRYLALVNWINKVSKSEFNVNEIKDEYDYLLSEYKRQYKIHKLKSRSSMIEVIVNMGTGLITTLGSGDFVGAFKSIIKATPARIKLMEEESKLLGRELSYVYHTQNRFQSGEVNTFNVDKNVQLVRRPLS
ncbi:hypothetical protein [Sinomicrobium sp. M5D2P9]